MIIGYFKIGIIIALLYEISTHVTQHEEGKLSGIRERLITICIWPVVVFLFIKSFFINNDGDDEFRDYDEN